MEAVYISFFLYFLLRILFLKKPFIYKKVDKKLKYQEDPNENVFFEVFSILENHFLGINSYFRVNPCVTRFYVFLEDFFFPYIPLCFLNFFQNFFYHLIYFNLFFFKVFNYFFRYFFKKAKFICLLTFKYFSLYLTLCFYYYYRVKKAYINWHFLNLFINGKWRLHVYYLESFV